MKTNYRNIVISGDVGTGTTTLGKAVAEKLGWEFLSVGDFFRNYHKEHNIPLWDKLAIPEDIERKIDYEILNKLEKESHFVIDSHYSGWFARNLKDVYKVLLKANLEKQIERALNREHTHKETREDVIKRIELLNKKFKILYGADNYEDPKYYNLVIDTTKKTLEESLQIVLNSLE